MANKVKITDGQGTQVFPYTHTTAVLDNNGNSVEQSLGVLHDLYEALTQSNIVVVASEDWPLAELEERTIYRVAGTTSYTDYMYDGTKAVPMATYDNAIDDVPTAGSDNLVKSGGVADAFSDPSKGFVYDDIIKGCKRPITSGAVYQKTAKLYNDEDNILSIADNNGNVIAKINSGVEIGEDGIIKTDSFNSENAALKDETIIKQDETTYHLSFSDGDGNIIVGINSGVKVDEEGIIKTKAFDSTLPLDQARSNFPKLDVNKTAFRWLDIGNSHSLCALYYLRRIAISQGVDLSNIAFCRLSRGGSNFKSFVQGYHNEDTSGTGDQLTGGMYDLYKDFGGLSVKVTGNTYTSVNSEATPVTDHELSMVSTRFWGGDGSIFRSLLADNKFDLITIHQRYISNEEYDNHERWRDNSEHGYLTEFIRIIKTTQPQACVGYLYSLVPFDYAGGTLNGMNDKHIIFNNTIMKFMSDSGVDFVIPCDTALENLRNSSVPNIPNEGTGASENIVSRYGFNYDSAHTAWGVAGYTMGCAAWEMVLARRYGKSVYGNTYRELISDDISYTPSGSPTTLKFMQGSYTNKNNEKVMIDNSAWNAPQYLQCTSSDGGTTWDYSGRAKATIRVSDNNAEACQMAAILAVNDIWYINNPDNERI